MSYFGFWKQHFECDLCVSRFSNRNRSWTCSSGETLNSTLHKLLLAQNNVLCDLCVIHLNFLIRLVILHTYRVFGYFQLNGAKWCSALAQKMQCSGVGLRLGGLVTNLAVTRLLQLHRLQSRRFMFADYKNEAS